MVSESVDEREPARLREEVRRLRVELGAQTAPLSMQLKRRGFSIYRQEAADDLLLPDQGCRDRYYELLCRYSFRLLLRDVIKHQPLFTLEQVTRFTTPVVTAAYLEMLRELGLVETEFDGYRLLGGPVRSFGPTLEWLVAEVLRREFAAEAAWGVKMRRPRVGGDYDVLARLDGLLVYLEVKSSPPRQIYQPEITGFFARTADLKPELSIFFMDTELRMFDKLVPMFELELATGERMERVEGELFRVAGREGGAIYLINSTDGIARNIQRVLADFHCRWRRWSPLNGSSPS